MAGISHENYRRTGLEEGEKPYAYEVELAFHGARPNEQRHYVASSPKAALRRAGMVSQCRSAWIIEALGEEAYHAAYGYGRIR